MLSRIQNLICFVRHFVTFTLYAGEVLVVLNLLIVCGGIAIWFVEKIELERAIYFAFITALTIGYGDITPETTIGHILSVLIGLIGMIFVGLIVAIASRALAETVKERHAEERESTR